MSEPVVSFEEWESGHVKLTDDIYDLVSIPSIFGMWPMHYKGRETGQLLGMWFAEACESGET